MEDREKNNHESWRSLPPSGRLLRPAEVVKRTGLSRSQVYKLISENRFPRFIKLGTRASAMPESWLDAFVASRAAGNDEILRRTSTGSSHAHRSTVHSDAFELRQDQE